MTAIGVIEKKPFDSVLDGLSNYLTSISPIFMVESSQMDTCNKAEEFGKEFVESMDNMEPARKEAIINGLVDISIKDKIYLSEFAGLLESEMSDPDQERLELQMHYLESLPLQERSGFYKGYVSSILERYKTAYWSIGKSFEKVDQREDYEKLLVCHSILHRITQKLEELSRKKIRNDEAIFRLMIDLIQVSIAGMRIVAFNQKKISLNVLYETCARMSVKEPVSLIIWDQESAE
jgi:hypothetical protein